jgi:hypothetical protein
MRCPRCRHVSDEELTCPQCGASLATSGVVKTASILISAGDAEGVYRSVDELPEPLRARFTVATQGLNSATILIADKRGREEIARALRKLPQSAQRRLFRSLSPDPEPQNYRVSLAHVVGALLAGSTGLLAWLIVSHRL